jgi:tetratricopeptide (TPR) repeat protein
LPSKEKSPARAALPSSEKPNSLPSNGRLLGRERELTEVRSAIDDAFRGRGRLLLLTGEPGIGKTGLADEAASLATSRGMRVYWGRCFEDAGAPAYWPWVQVLRGVVADAGSQYGRTLPADIVRMFPELAAEAPQPEAGDAEQHRFRLFDGVARLLKEAASAKPIMLALDDLHDADVASLQLLKFVARLVHDAKLMIVGTYRVAEMRHSKERVAIIQDVLRDATRLSLAGLAENEISLMVEMRAQHAPDPNFVADLTRTTGGNPLFVDGIMRVLAAEGRFGSAQPIALAGYKLPDEVRAAIQRWLGLLSPEARTLLTTAALIGQEFELKLLGQATATAPERVAELISSAQEIGIASAVGKSLCRFAHPLLREVLFQEPTGSEQVRLHRAIATALEEIQGPDTQSYISLLAHHWRESAQSPEEIDKAIDYLIRAGQAAARVSALREAVLCWEDALRMNAEHGRVLLQRSEILMRLAGVWPGREQQAVRNLEDALAIYEHLGMTTEVAAVHSRLCGLLQFPLYDLPRAEKHFRKAEALLRPMPPSKCLAQLYVHWCNLCISRGNISEAFEAVSRAEELAEGIDDPSFRGSVGIAKSSCLFGLGRLRECLELTERVWQQADKINEAWIAGAVTLNSCFFLLNLRDYGQALKWSRRETSRPRNKRSGYYEAQVGLVDEIISLAAMAELNDLGQLTSEISGLAKSAGKSWLMFWAGDFEGVRARWTAFVDNIRSQQRRENVCQEAPFLAYLLRLAGYYDTAENLQKEALFYSVSGGYVPMEMLARQSLSQIYAETGRTEEARANLARCREIMSAGEDWRGIVGLVSVSEAIIAAAEQRFDEAYSHYADALRLIHRYGIRWIEGPTLCDWGRTLSAAGQRDQALEKFDAAIELYRRIGAGQPWIERAETDRAKVGSSRSNGAKPGPTSVEAQFRKEGDYWTIRYGEKLLRLKNSKGLSYIAQLLLCPEREIHALVLTGGVEMNGPGGASEILDSAARSDYQHRIAELREELEEAESFNDEGRSAKARAEIEALQSHLSDTVGLGGRSRRASTDAERARVAVTKGIKTAIQQIRAMDPALGRHLSTSISTGYFCSYHLDRSHPVSWQL